MKSGFIKLIIFVVVAVVILSLFKVRLSTVFENQFVKDNFGFIWNAIVHFFNDHIYGPVSFAWNQPFGVTWDAIIGKLSVFLKEQFK